MSSDDDAGNAVLCFGPKPLAINHLGRAGIDSIAGMSPTAKLPRRVHKLVQDAGDSPAKRP